MRQIAQIDNGKIVNIGLWETVPQGDAYLDVTDNDPPAKMGDEIIDGKVVSQDAVKTLADAQQLCLRAAKAAYSEANEQLIDGFRIESLSALWIANAISAGAALNLVDDTGQGRVLSTDDATTLINKLFAANQDAAKAFAQQETAIQSAASIDALATLLPTAFPSIHPQAQAQ